MDLHSGESMILEVGDLKLSDTHGTFGEKRDVNGYQYTPLENPEAKFFSDISDNIANGDFKEGVSISGKKDKIFLIYGANSIGSNAQSMAIGYYNGSEYFFVEECFSNIYEEKPRLTSRRIVRCRSLWESSREDIIKTTFNCYNQGKAEELTPEENKLSTELFSKIQLLKEGLTKESLSNLRKRELFLKKRGIQQPEDEER